ncbi:ATP-dependent endonuclease [Streptomyces sp. NPDC056534]|uniref:ATP-dependent nuclease n=1 Tax=Streptomyces sp. NPDC056534 TaxID=3345857 RepID=UPI0036847506
MRIASIQIRNWKSFEDTGNLHLGRINVLLGRNNSGKSALLRAIHLLQNGSDQSIDNIRIGESHATVTHELVRDNNLDFELSRHLQRDITRNQGSIEVYTTLEKQRGTYSCDFGGIATYGGPPIPALEPSNLIYTYFSKRKVAEFDRTVDRSRTQAVAGDLRNLVAKVSRLSSPDYVAFDEYTRLCTEVLGFRVGSYASTGGSQAGISIGHFDHVPIESMGEGVSSLLGLITDLCMGQQNVFLIEEPENDVHPESLKSLLRVIVEKSEENQFIVTTHSNIVTRFLGSAPESKVFSIESAFIQGAVPTSRVREIEGTPEARIEVLRGLGYELSDFDLWDAWLILEESSAEMVISYLIRWFVPRLSRVRTLAAGGVSKALPTFEDFRRLFLFAHLEHQYKGRAWVVVDGDEPGNEVVAQLRSKYPSWPANRFTTWTHGDFEMYYPDRFKEKATEVLELPRDKKRHQKGLLTREVRKWITENPEEAKLAFEESAQEVITFLRQLDTELFGAER